MDDWLEFLGYAVSEGCVHEAARKHGHYNVSLSQSLTANPEQARQMTDLLDRLPIKWTVIDTADGCRNWHVGDKSLWTWLAANIGTGSRNKRLPGFFRDLGKRQATILLEALMLGDGSADPRPRVKHYGRSYGTSSSQLADDVQELAFKLGYRTHATCNSRGLWIIGITDGRDHFLRREHVTRESYSGVVWCVEVENHLFVTRRNGVIAVHGNTTNRSTSESMIDIQFRVGTMPVVRHVEDVVNLFIREHLKLRAELRFDKGQDVEERISLARAHDIYVRNGTLSSDEVRAELGRPTNRDRPTPRMIESPRLGPIPLIAVESIAGLIDPETYAPATEAPLVPHPFIPAPGVAPVQGSLAYGASQASSANMQREMIAQSTGTKPASVVPPQPPTGSGPDRPLSADEVAAAKGTGKGVRAAGIAVVAADTGRVLLQQRALKDDTKDAAGLWEFPGGRLDDGESAWESALREFGEESGVDLLGTCGDAQLIGVLADDDNDYVCYVVTVPSEADLPINVRFAESAGV